MLGLTRAPRRGFAAGLLSFLAMLGGWAATPAASNPLPGAHDEIIYVIAGGWHTEIAVPRTAVDGRRAILAAGSPAARYLVFGWGARDFYMAQHPGLADLLRAAVPGPAALLVFPLAVPPAAYFGAGNVWPIAITRAGIARLVQFLWESVATDRRGSPIRAGTGPYSQSVFYVATGTYDATDTCNTWTADGLRAAGVPVKTAGVVLARQLLDQLPTLEAAASSADHKK